MSSSTHRDHSLRPESFQQLHLGDIFVDSISVQQEAKQAPELVSGNVILVRRVASSNQEMSSHLILESWAGCSLLTLSRGKKLEAASDAGNAMQCRRFKRRHTEMQPISSQTGYSSGGMGYSSGGLVSGFNPGDGTRPRILYRWLRKFQAASFRQTAAS